MASRYTIAPGGDIHLDPPPSQGSLSACDCTPPPEGYKSRNLVVCIDPPHVTNQNTNIVELFDRLERNEGQLTYYSSGVAITGGASWGPLRYVRQIIGKIASAVNWNSEDVIFDAYSWLSDHYQQGDRIFLFGFSRGAHQVRALAAMIHKVGLLRKGNTHQIPLVYDFYLRTDEEGWKASLLFKNAFARRDVRVHFVGVWDTVAIISVVADKRLPFLSYGHICFFRHALALDEHRVKFLPQYGMPPDQVEAATILSQPPRVKEVWFSGSHSDVGGGSVPFRGRRLELADISLLWMQNEAVTAGLHFRKSDVEWKFDEIDKCLIRDQLLLNAVWWIFELLPLRRQNYTGPEQLAWTPNYGNGRAILPGQKIHASVAFRRRGYRPRATFADNQWNFNWVQLVGEGPSWNLSPSLPGNWADILEMDVFDYISGPYAIAKLSDPDPHPADVLHILTRLQFMVMSERGREAICRVSGAVPALAAYLATDGNDSGTKAKVAEILDKLATCDAAKVALIERDVMASLINVLKSKEDTIKSTVANIMLEIMKFDDAGVKIRQLDAIVPMASSNDNQVRNNALDALENFVRRDDSRQAICEPGALSSLVDLLKSVYDRTKTVTCRALCIFAQDKNIRVAICLQSDVFSSLVDILKSELYWTRGFAVEVFETFARYEDCRVAVLQSNTISLLTSLLKCEHCGTRESAANVLKVFTQYGNSREAILQSEALSSLVDVLTNEDKWARGAAANVLKEFANHEDSRVAVLKSNIFSRLVNADSQVTSILEKFAKDSQ